jgi:hypothetical protein
MDEDNHAINTLLGAHITNDTVEGAVFAHDIERGTDTEFHGELNCS